MLFPYLIWSTLLLSNSYVCWFFCFSIIVKCISRCWFVSGRGLPGKYKSIYEKYKNIYEVLVNVSLPILYRLADILCILIFNTRCFEPHLLNTTCHELHRNQCHVLRTEFVLYHMLRTTSYYSSSVRTYNNSNTISCALISTSTSFISYSINQVQLCKHSNYDCIR